MAIEKEFSAKTVDEAISLGLKDLNLTHDDVEVEIVTEGKKGGLFGIGAVPAKVKLTVKEKPVATEEKKEEKASAPSEKKVERKEEKPAAEGESDGQRAVKFLEGLLPLLGSDLEVVLASEAEKIEIELKGENAKKIVGRRGEKIDAIQVLAGAVANTGREEYVRVVVNCGNYREEREATLRHVAEKMADKAVRLGKKVRLEPMNPYERRIIHSTLVDYPDVTTKSEGKEPNRFVVIIPKNFKPYEKREDRKGGRSYGDKRYGDRKGGDRKYSGERKLYPKRELPAEGTPQSSGTSFKKEGAARPTGYGRFIGTYLGNSKDNENSETTSGKTETEE